MRRRRSVPVEAFDVSADRWIDADVSGRADRDKLTLATYNVWFNEFHAERRYRVIADLLCRKMPDVMVFQEVTPQALDVFCAQPWVRQHYRRAEVTGSDVGHYGLLMLTRLPVGRVTYTPLPTRLARGFLTAEFTVNGHPVVVAAIHLESSKAASRMRSRQWGRITRTLRRAETAVVLGDFNLRNAENGLLGAPYVDLWPTLRPGEDGFTEDTSINLMRYDMKNKHRHVRFDRVLLKGDAWQGTTIELLGTEPVDAALPRVFPSDHFGVLCQLGRRPGKDAEAERRQSLWPGWRAFRY